MSTKELTEALFKVIKGGDPENSMHFIDKGADINGRDESGNTPLMHASMSWFY